MHEVHDLELRKELNGSAAWLAGLSPIGSPAPHQNTTHSALRQHGARIPISPVNYRDYTGRRSEAAMPPPPQFELAPSPSSLYPHLVRSHSPPVQHSLSPLSAAQRDTGTGIDDTVPVESASQEKAAARVRNTFADVLGREWPFTPTPRDAPDVVEAVRFGQESALLHYVNGGFKDVASRLAPEVRAVAVEAERWRLAAQHSTLQCRLVTETYTQAKEELLGAQQRLQLLLAGADRKEADVENAQQQSHEGAQPLTSSALSDTSSAALTLQLDQELTTMRTQKQRYEVLCVQKARLETQLEEWTQKEKKLSAKLERVQVQQSAELEDHLRSARTRRPPLTARSPSGGQRPICGSWQRELDVCITERAELLRHLQGGTAKRLEQLKALLTRLEEHSAGDRTRSADSAGAAAQTSPTCPLWILERLSTVHQSVSLGEEAALTEMEHLRVLLQRLQRQERRDSAVGQQLALTPK